jgi:hypothetical protein
LGFSFNGVCGVFNALLSAASKRACDSFSSNLTGSFVMSGLLTEFEDYQRERDLIGQMLLSYGELEFVLVGMIADALSVDNPTAARILFRVNGEGPRMQVADAIIRPVCAKHNLKSKWINAHSAAKHCKSLRNQYAHCHWQLWNGTLSFLDLDSESRLPGEEDMEVTLQPIDRALILKQHQYFEYAALCLYFVRDRLKRSLGKPPEDPPFPEPKSIQRPPLGILPKKANPTPAEAKL